MGREIRRVPKGWEHPKDSRGKYKSMHDQTYKEVAEEWWAQAVAWHDRDPEAYRAAGGWLPEGEEEDLFEKHPWFWEWTDRPPNPDYYRPEFDAPADCYQYYQNTSEGTPLSPVCETVDEMVAWLVENEGMTEEGARSFVGAGYAPTYVSGGGGGLRRGVDAFNEMLGDVGNHVSKGGSDDESDSG